MQDRFKFRAWNKLSNEMKDVISLNINHEFPECSNVILETNTFDDIKTHNKPITCANGLNNVVLMQCTGLKDKNGKLIYDGDIIVIPDLYPFYDYKNKETPHKSLNETYGKIEGESILNYIGIVEWIFSQWQYVYHCVNPAKVGISEGINHSLNENGYDESEETEFEVIGNIYKDSHLVKNSNNLR